LEINATFSLQSTSDLLLLSDIIQNIMYNLLIMVKVTSAASYVLGDLPTASYTYNDISLTHHVSGNGMHFLYS